MIAIENLRKSFGGVEVLRGVSFDVADREIVALIGPSGVGKSVFLKLVAGLLRPDGGRVVFNGRDMSRLRRRELAALRSRFGFLFQGGALFDSLSVYDNVAFPLREKTGLGETEIAARVQQELAQVGLEGAHEKYPGQLSGGMAKRVALARALILGPEFMLFDEPTTGLDPIIVHAIHDLIQVMHRRLGFSGIIVSHAIPSIFAITQKVVMLDRGVIRFAGTPREILAADDPDVRAFIRGSLPPEPFRRSERGASGAGSRTRGRAMKQGRFRLELAVGVFMLIGMACLAYLSIRLGKVEVRGRYNYEVYAVFSDIGGLREGAPVVIAGVNVGRVTGISLDHEEARVVMQLVPGLQVREDAIVSVKTSGLIGEKFLQISGGAANQIIPPGGRIRQTESAVDLAELIGKAAFGNL